MQLHSITRKHPNKKSRQIGRGGKRGTTAGRGTKGQNARAGHKKRPEIRDIIKKIPKLRGYQVLRMHDKPAVVNLGVLEKACANGESVSVRSLIAKGLVSTEGSKLPVVKILGNGSFSKKLHFLDVILSESAKKRVTDSGGSFK